MYSPMTFDKCILSCNQYCNQYIGHLHTYIFIEHQKASDYFSRNWFCWIFGDCFCSNSYSLPHTGKPVLSHSLYALWSFIPYFTVVGSILIHWGMVHSVLTSSVGQQNSLRGREGMFCQRQIKILSLGTVGTFVGLVWGLGEVRDSHVF